MASTYYPPQPLPYQPITPPTATNPIGLNNTSDPRKLAQNQRQLVQGGGDALQANDQALASQYLDQTSGTQSYLNPIENTLATGGGGYNPDEVSQIQLQPADASQIELSPEDKQNIISGAGITAGAGTASAVGAAERAAAAGGGNPMALATYRLRAAQQGAAQGADAMTQARIGAQQAGSQGAQAAQQLRSAGATTTGNARLNQQNEGLGYYNSLQQEQNQNAQNEQALQHGAFGTTVSGTNAATDTGLKASQTPSTLDKVIGAGVGAASAYLADGMDAVAGENGPEAIVEAASDPVRHQTFMDDGGEASAPLDIYAQSGVDPAYSGTQQSTNSVPWLDKLRAGFHQATAQKQPGAQQKAPWSPVDTWSGLGKVIGEGASYLADGMEMGVASTRPALFQTKPVRPTPDSGFGTEMGPPTAGNEGIWKNTNLPNDIKSDENYMKNAAFREQASRRADPQDKRGFADWAHDDMQKAAASAMQKRRMLPSGHMADGYGADGPRLPKSPALPKPPMIVSSPTHVSLAPGDKVIPLSYRPHAKVRPSVAMDAFKPHMRQSYGTARA